MSRSLLSFSLSLFLSLSLSLSLLFSKVGNHLKWKWKRKWFSVVLALIFGQLEMLFSLIEFEVTTKHPIFRKIIFGISLKSIQTQPKCICVWSFLLNTWTLTLAPHTPQTLILVEWPSYQGCTVVWYCSFHTNRLNLNHAYFLAFWKYNRFTILCSVIIHLKFLCYIKSLTLWERYYNLREIEYLTMLILKEFCFEML